MYSVWEAGARGMIPRIFLLERIGLLFVLLQLYTDELVYDKQSLGAQKRKGDGTMYRAEGYVKQMEKRKMTPYSHSMDVGSSQGGMCSTPPGRQYLPGGYVSANCGSCCTVHSSDRSCV